MSDPIGIEAEAREAAGRIDPAKYLRTLEELIRIPSPSGEEGAISDYVVGRLREIGMEEIEVDRHANVLAQLGRGDRRLLIISHIDSMRPPTNMQDPFTPRYGELDGERVIYGLGAATPKSCVAAMIEAMAVLREFQERMPTVTFVSSTRDLHPTEHGIGDLFKEHSISSDGAIVGEPTRLRLGIGARGYTHIEMNLAGQPHHAGRPDQRRNPVSAAAEFVHRALAESLPEHPLLGAATLTPIEWSSEGQRPQTPRTARVLMDRRLLPADPPVEALRDQFCEWAQAYSDLIQVQAHVRRHQFPWEVSQEEPVVRALAQAVALVTGSEPVHFPLSHSSACGHIKTVVGITPVAFSGGDIADIGANDHLVIERGIDSARALAAAVLFFGNE